MIKKYIKPITGVIVNAIDVPILAGSDDGNTHAAKQFSGNDNWEEVPEDVSIKWPQSKNPWNDCDRPFASHREGNG